MRISRKAEYALRSLITMAGNRRSWTISELSRIEGIPAKILEQVLLALKRGGLLMSMRGVKGGYSFRQDPSSITVAAVLTLIDGPISPVPCVSGFGGEQCSCPDPRRCSLQRLMRQARNALQEIFEGRTIEDLAKEQPSADVLSFEI